MISPCKCESIWRRLIYGKHIDAVFSDIGLKNFVVIVLYVIVSILLKKKKKEVNT